MFHFYDHIIINKYISTYFFLKFYIVYKNLIISYNLYIPITSKYITAIVRVIKAIKFPFFITKALEI